MKIKVVDKPYAEVMALPRPPHKFPPKPSWLLHTAIHIATPFYFGAIGFKRESVGMERAGKGPWLVLMNHCSFMDNMILALMLDYRRYQVITTTDGFVGKEGFMRALGCIPTQKYVKDIRLIADMKHALEKNRTCVVMHPEAGYSFDGTAAGLPDRLSRLFKSLKVPVVIITTFGNFTRQPLYNNLHKRKVKLGARIECLFTPEEIASLPVETMDARLREAFSLDYFRWQAENKVPVLEPFRAEGLDRILYRCPSCQAEGETEGQGATLTCRHCGKQYFMDEYGRMSAKEGPTEYPHIPDWYAWERDVVRREVREGLYSQTLDVEICMLVDFKALYRVGTGTLHHDAKGFILDGCNGELHYEQSPLESYSVNCDFYWYELGDIICIGDRDKLFYCFPRQRNVVAKVRLAAEEIYAWLHDNPIDSTPL